MKTTKKLKPLLILFLLTLCGCNGNFFKVVSSSYVKEYCSCRFVVSQTQSYCHQYASQIVSVSSHTEDKKAKAIQAQALGFTSQAKFISPLLGCQLTK